ncbi:hypothetical protein [Nocardia rhizosphaerae]|uniref:Uncharacterized protein n=1 Tax=Nocardia rhizosphaerae TaxID=1691571 RepID=A0ABV8L504_9NOCA
MDDFYGRNFATVLQVNEPVSNDRNAEDTQHLRQQLPTSGVASAEEIVGCSVSELEEISSGAGSFRLPDQDNGELPTGIGEITGGATGDRCRGRPSAATTRGHDAPVVGRIGLPPRTATDFHVSCFVKYCSGIEFPNNEHAEFRPVGTSFSARLYRTAFPLVIVSALGETLSLGKDRVEMADKSKKAPKKMPKQMSRQQQQQRQEQMGDEPQGMTRAGQEDRREQRRPGQH